MPKSAPTKKTAHWSMRRYLNQRFQRAMFFGSSGKIMPEGRTSTCLPPTRPAMYPTRWPIPYPLSR